MKLAVAIIESLWGITLPLEHLAPLASQCGHACLDTLLRRGR